MLRRPSGLAAFLETAGMKVFQRGSKLLCYLAFAPLHSFSNSLILNTPVAGPGFSAILSNGSTTISWTYSAIDPSEITLMIQNYLSPNIWEVASGVAVSVGSITKDIDVLPQQSYYVSAVDVSNYTNTYASSPVFFVAGIAATTTNTSLDLWTTTTTIVTKSMITITMGLNQNSLTSTDQPSATMSRMGPGTTNNSKNSGGAPVGAFVGAAIAAAIFLCVILASIYHCRRRRSKVRTVFPLVHDETYIPLSMGPNAYPSHSGGGDRLEQLRSKKAAAQRHHDRLRSDLERNHKTRNKQRRGSSSGARSEAANLRHQVQVLSARISELEAQQRELELFGGSSPPPPNYTPIALEPFQNLH